MSILSFAYDLIIGPIVLLFDTIFSLFYTATVHVGISIIALSIAVNLLVLPLYRRADAMQEEERVRLVKLKPGVDHIKKVFKGDERFMMMQTYYRQNSYKPYYSLKGSLSLLLEIPFFIAAYGFLSKLNLLNRASFLSISDLGQPDGLLHIAGWQFNLLPVLMTAINIVSGIIYTRGMPLKSKIQLYGMALLFLVLLYDSPAGLVFYWTLNNLFSLGKNIYYRLQNPLRTLGIACFALGCVLLPYVCIRPMMTAKKQLFVILCLMPLFLILPLYQLSKKFGAKFFRKSSPGAEKSHDALFTACCLLMTVMTGLLIPSAVINASPGEFVNRFAFRTPLRYIVYSSAIAAGTFLIWLNIFYRLSSSRVKRFLSLCAPVVSLWAAVNYLFFGSGYGNMSSTLQYSTLLRIAPWEILLNTAVLAATAAGVYFIWKRSRKWLQFAAFVMSAAVLIMSGINVFSISGETGRLRQSLDTLSPNEGIEIPLDKSGKNVIVIMMDRAICDFFPYMIEEKPQLRQQLAGFTYYPNTIAFGSTTLVGAPALFGGYEYTPENINRRSESTLKDKHNESMKLMPALFSDNGYNVTVCDPPFAGFEVFSDLTIYNDYPEINKYITKGKFSDSDNEAKTDAVRKRNFFAYSLMRTSPVLLHSTLYDKGMYNHSGQSSVQVLDSLYTAHGGVINSSEEFNNAYSVLKQLPALTKATDEGKNTFTMLANDSTHDIIMLQEPAYEPSETVDNVDYEATHGTRHSADGSGMTFTTAKQIKHYQCNMASMLRLGEWMDYLRENGLYDNTRIIIVSDHGKDLDFLFGEKITDGDDKIPSDDNRINYSDIMAYKPLLLVKDFGSTELTTDYTFMTNADTPSLAFEGLIDDPVNPFTGNKINTDAKGEKKHHIAGTNTWNPTDYSDSETTLKDLVWIEFTGNDTSDLSAWRGIGNRLD